MDLVVDVTFGLALDDGGSVLGVGVDDIMLIVGSSVRFVSTPWVLMSSGLAFVTLRLLFVCSLGSLPTVELVSRPRPKVADDRRPMARKTKIFMIDVGNSRW